MDMLNFDSAHRDPVDLDIQLFGKTKPGFEKILTPAAIQFVAKLQRGFGSTRERLLNRRVEIQERINFGEFPKFLSESRDIRASEWTVSPIPADILDRRV